MATLPHGPVDSPAAPASGRRSGAILAACSRCARPYVLAGDAGAARRITITGDFIGPAGPAGMAGGHVDLTDARPGTVTHHARAFQFGTARIAVPPGGDASAEASWTAPFPMNVVLLSTHSHKHTTGRRRRRPPATALRRS
jgi:hypothetical protein